jgi:hypothetical protein
MTESNFALKDKQEDTTNENDVNFEDWYKI